MAVFIFFSQAITVNAQRTAENWENWSIVPEISQNAKELLKEGIEERGTNPHWLSKTGDCHSVPSILLGVYDTNYYYFDPSDSFLEKVVSQYHGCFSQGSVTARDGMGAASVLSPMWNDPDLCETDESPLDCEIRIHNPSIMLVSLGSNGSFGISGEGYTEYLRKILDTLTEHGILPVLITKCDDVEGGNYINEIVTEMSLEYDIPLINFWRKCQNLDNGGMNSSINDGVHLSVEAWNWRNYYVISTLYKIGEGYLY